MFSKFDPKEFEEGVYDALNKQDKQIGKVINRVKERFETITDRFDDINDEIESLRDRMSKMSDLERIERDVRDNLNKIQEKPDNKDIDTLKDNLNELNERVLDIERGLQTKVTENKVHDMLSKEVSSIPTKAMKESVKMLHRIIKVRNSDMKGRISNNLDLLKQLQDLDFNQTEISDILDVSRQSIHRNMKKLEGNKVDL